MKRLLICCCVTSILLTGCTLPFFAAPAGQPGPQAWIDQPLDGSTLPLAPVAILAHTSDPDGIARFALSVNDSPAVECAGDAPSASGDGSISACLIARVNSFGAPVPISLHATWSPPAPGRFVLRIRAQNMQGIWGAYASAVFTIAAEAPTVTSTPEPTTTPSPTGTMTPTASPTAGAVNFTLVQVTPNLFHHSNACGPNDPNCQSACSPNQINIRVQVSEPELVNSVVLFFFLVGKKSSTGWNEGVSMHSLGNGLYEYNLLADKVPDAQSFGEAIFKYQFVATDINKNILARSQVFSDVTMSACP